MAKKTTLVKLNEMDIEIILGALGDKINRMSGTMGYGKQNKATQKVVDKIYKAMGIKLDAQ